MPNQYVALANVDPKEVISRILNEESTVTIAKGYGVSRWALNKFLIKHAEEDWKDAQIARALTRKEQAEDDLDKITKESMDGETKEKVRLTKDDAPMQNVKLKAAEIRLKSAQWDLERVCKRIFGNEQQNNQSPVVINIGIKRGVTINQDEVTIEQTEQNTEQDIEQKMA